MLGNAKLKPANASDFSHPPKRYSLTQKGTYQIRRLSGDKDFGFDNYCVSVRTPVKQGFRCSRRELSELSFLLRLTSE